MLVRESSLARACVGLQYLADKKPPLSVLIKELPANLDLNSEWLVRYAQIQQQHDPYFLVMRTMLGEKTLRPWRGGRPCDPHFAEARAVEYLANSPFSYLVNYSRDSSLHERLVPRTIKMMAPEEKKRVHDIALTLSHRVARRPDMSANTQDACARIYKKFLLDPEDYVDLLEGRQQLNQTKALSLFQGSVAEVRGHNIMALIAAIGMADLDAGKAQDKIPAAAALEYLRCNFRSLPVLDFLGDILDLRDKGIVPSLHEHWEGIYRDVVAARNAHESSRNLWGAFIADYALMRRDRSQTYQAFRDSGGRHLHGYSGLRFNLCRWLQVNESSLAYDAFAPAYDKIDVQKLKTAVEAVAESASPGICSAAFSLADEIGIEHPVQYRDITNIVLHCWHQNALGRQQWEALSSVARYALGESDPRGGPVNAGSGGGGASRADKSPLGQPRADNARLRAAVEATG